MENQFIIIKMQTRRESPKITPSLLTLYDKKTLDTIKTTYYLRKRVGCTMTYPQYVKTLKKLGFVSGMRIIRIDKKLPWSPDNIRVYDDSVHNKMKTIDAFYRDCAYQKPKKIIIKMRDKEVV